MTKKYCGVSRGSAETTNSRNNCTDKYQKMLKLRRNTKKNCAEKEAAQKEIKKELRRKIELLAREIP